MEQILQRGYAVADGVRIRTMVAQGQKWQLYLTNRNHWVLVATAELVQFWTQTYGVESLPRELLADGDPGYYRPRFYLAGAVSVYSEWLCSDRTRPIEDVAEVVADALGHARWSAVQGGEQAKAAAAGIKKTELFPQNGGSPAAFEVCSLHSRRAQGGRCTA